MSNSLATYQVRTFNVSSHSENRMHSDEVAKQFGYKGALVPGVTVFSHMTQPLVARFGKTWLARGTADVRFAKPAYDSELLTVSSTGTTEFDLTCNNEQGVELARMHATLPDTAGVADARGDIAPAPPISERPEVTWDLMEINKPFPALIWQPARADNEQWCRDNREALPIFNEGDYPLLHPGFILRQGNYVLRNRFLLPAWIHTASRIRFLKAARVGPAYEIRAIPEEKWNRKGHEFARLFVAIRCEGRTVAEILHEMIFRPAVRGE